MSMPIQKAKFSIGDIVKHKHFEFRGVIYDVDFEFNNSEEWYQSIPKNVIGNRPQTLKFTQNSSDCVLQTISLSNARLKKK